MYTQHRHSCTSRSTLITVELAAAPTAAFLFSVLYHSPLCSCTQSLCTLCRLVHKYSCHPQCYTGNIPSCNLQAKSFVFDPPSASVIGPRLLDTTIRIKATAGSWDASRSPTAAAVRARSHPGTTTTRAPCCTRSPPPSMRLLAQGECSVSSRRSVAVRMRLRVRVQGSGLRDICSSQHAP